MVVGRRYLLVALFSFLVVAPAASQPATAATATWFILSLQWRPGVCYNTQTVSPKNTAPRCNPPPVNPATLYTIYGFWGQDRTKSVNCPRPFHQLPRVLDKALELELLMKWPDLYANSSPMIFWGLEYGKHGACLFNNDYVAYFEAGLDLREKLVTQLLGGMELEAFLDNAGISPGNMYDINDLLDAFNNRLNIMPMLACSTYPIAVQGKKPPQLSELRFCIDAQNMEFVNCTASLGPTAASNYGTCSQSYIWLGK